MYEYLLGLGKGVGAGLTEAVDMEPAVGKVFGEGYHSFGQMCSNAFVLTDAEERFPCSAWSCRFSADSCVAHTNAGAAFSLNVKARGSRVNRENCYKAAGLGQDVLRILDSAWRRNTSAVSRTIVLPLNSNYLQHLHLM